MKVFLIKLVFIWKIKYAIWNNGKAPATHTVEAIWRFQLFFAIHGARFQWQFVHLAEEFFTWKDLIFSANVHPVSRA